MNEHGERREVLQRIYPVYIASEAAPFHRVNEDTVMKGHNFAGVFDGVGGIDYGEKASQVAAEVIRQRLDIGLSRTISLPEVRVVMEDAWENAAATLTLEKRRLGLWEDIYTTAVVAAVVSRKLDRFVVHAHTGDSRLYSINRDKSLSRRTEDHGQAYELFMAGQISPERYRHIVQALDEITIRQDIARYEGGFGFSMEGYWKTRNKITNSLSSNPKDRQKRMGFPTIATFEITPDMQALLLVSDGVSDQLSFSEMSDVVRNTENMATLPHNLLNEAKRIRGIGNSIRIKPGGDDMSAAVMRI